MRATRFSLCLCLAVLFTGCTQFPALDNVEGPGVEAAAYPRLLSAQELDAIPASATSLAVQASLLDRIRALEARAARLQRPVIDPATRGRMARGVR